MSIIKKVGSWRQPKLTRQKKTVYRSKTLKENQVESSSCADELRRLTELAKSLPDIRREKIEAIKKKIKAGTYDVPAKLVAEKIIELYNELKTDKK